MIVGIVTFHWATNYGAILQTYALQEAIRSLGYDVEIINYKPYKYDDNLWTFIRFRKFLNYTNYILNRKKEKELNIFRKNYLRLTKRFGSLKELQQSNVNYDVLITGSDQVLNHSFLKNGETKGSTAYFLDFGASYVKRMAYAASFGTTEYPFDLCKKVRPLIKKFQSISTRENSGLKIFMEMGASNPVIVCDPTILHSRDFYDNIIAETQPVILCTRAYFLRGREKKLRTVLTEINASMIKNESMVEWIKAVKNSSHFVTNSYHGLVFCLLYHIPFSVVLEHRNNVGMNDRFYTLLSPLNLTDRIFTEDEFTTANTNFNKDWKLIDAGLENIRNAGWNFLKENI